MEENEISWELNISSVSALFFIETMTISTGTTITTHLSSYLSSDPLFSCVITLCTLILLYFPRVFVKVALSPVLVLTSILLLSLLRLGAAQKSQSHINKGGDDGNDRKIQSFVEQTFEDNGNDEKKSIESLESEETDVVQEVHKWVTCKTGFESEIEAGFEDRFVEWDVRAPLEVIYEGYNEGDCEQRGKEEEEEEVEEIINDPDPKENDPTRLVRYPSLSRYYPETDTDTDSGSDATVDGGSPVIGEWGSSPDNICFRWDEEDREGLIEIALDDMYHNNNNNNIKGEIGFHFEEENLIEIDISPVKNNGFSID